MLIFYTLLFPPHVRVPMEISGFLFSVRRSNQSVLKEINPEHLLEGLILKLKLQYFGPLMQRADSLETEAWHAAVHGVTKSWIQLSD